MLSRRDLGATLLALILAGMLAVATLLPQVAAMTVDGTAGSGGPGNSARGPVVHLEITPQASRTVDVAYAAVPTTMQRLLDRCDGPVSVRFDGIRQRLLAQHDYCGGRWILGLEKGDVVRVYGGEIGGRYRVNGNIKVVRKDTSIAVLKGMGAVVAQTCRPDGDTLRLVGLSRID